MTDKLSAAERARILVDKKIPFSASGMAIFIGELKGSLTAALADLDAAKVGYDKGIAAAQDLIYHEQDRAIKAEAQVERLREALEKAANDLLRMEDCFRPGSEARKSAAECTQAAFATLAPSPQSSGEAQQPHGLMLCRGGIDPGNGPCPKCGATMDEDCRE